jgi:hypothetical protein
LLKVLNEGKPLPAGQVHQYFGPQLTGTDRQPELASDATTTIISISKLMPDHVRWPMVKG